MKRLGVNLTKHVQALYAENYSVLMEDIKEDLLKWSWQRYKHIDQRNTIKNPEIHAQKYIFDKDAKANQWRNDSLFNKWNWSNWTKISSKHITDLNVNVKL